MKSFDESYLGYIDCNTVRAGYPESKRLAPSAPLHPVIHRRPLSLPSLPGSQPSPGVSHQKLHLQYCMRCLRPRTECEATGVNSKSRQVTFRRAGGETFTEEYDRLIIATGAEPFVPPVEGKDLPGVSLHADPR